MKKLLSIFACVAMVIVGGVALVACGGGTADVMPTSTSKEITFAGLSDWKNTNDFKLEDLGNNKFKAKGTVATMSAEQGTAWGNIAEGSKYVILSIKMKTGSTMKTGWKSVETADTAFGENEGSNKTYNGTEGVKEFILGLSDGETPMHADAPVWRIEVTAPVSEGSEAKTVSYTIDFSEIYA